MKISIQWLSDYVDTTWSPETIADRLTMSGLEVESVESIGPTFDGIVVGRVLDVARHPQADRLTVCSVDLGSESPVQIVCGAPNVAAGQLVPVAVVGTTLRLPDRTSPDGTREITLSRAKIRGEESNGMICAEDEIGLSDDHSGIMVLATDAVPGEPFAEWLARNGRASGDAVLDVSITPNRPDAVSHIGIARDIAALSGSTLRLPPVSVPTAGGEAASAFSVDVEAPDGCGRYVGLLVRGVTVGESPDWLKARLEAIGLRPRSNIVDITNYVMFECGQPLHAFDFDRLAGRRIVVRRTRGDSRFTTLDGKERTLPDGTLMIADGERDVAVAGIMGGANTEVSEATVNVLIESAWFEPSGIRRTAKALGLQTDASYRFERGVDPELQAWAAARAAQLMVQEAGGTLVPGSVDVRPVRPETRTTVLRAARIESVLGAPVPAGDVERLLAAIGFGTSEIAGGWTVTIPSFRPDVSREIDCIEEVARLRGFDAIPEPAASRVPHENYRTPAEREIYRRVADLLVGYGYREVYTNSLMRRETAAEFADPVLRAGRPVGAPVETVNPISQEMAVLRPSLLPGALQVLSHNLSHGQRGMRVFEIGTVIDRFDAPDTPIAGFRERTHLLIGASGVIEPAGWDRSERTADAFDVKGVVEALFADLDLPVRFVPSEGAHPLVGAHLRIESGDGPVGLVGPVSRALAVRHDFRTGAFFAEIDLQAVAAAAAERGNARYREISRFPVVERDLALVVSAGQPVGPLVDAIRRAGGELVRSVAVFDVFRDERLGADRKSVAFSLRLGADRTLRDEEIDRVVSRIVTALERQAGARLRS